MKHYIPYAIMICILAAIVPYFDSLRGDFVFDDVPLIQNDPFYAQEANPLKCWQRDFWQENRKQGLYRPLTLFTYWLNAKTSGYYSPAFRIGNLILHLIVTLLVFKLSLRLKLGYWAAIFASAIFAVHPIHTEAVIPAFGRGELLCAMFLMIALISHTYVYTRKYAFLIAGSSFLLACWSKEHGIAALPLFILVDLYLDRPFTRERFMRFVKDKVGIYGFYCTMLAVFFASRYFALGTIVPSKANFDPAIDNPIALCRFPLNLISALKVQGLALFKFFWPSALCHDYSYAQLLPSNSVLDWTAWLTLLLFSAVPLSIILLFKNIRFKVIFMLMAYVVCILPAGNFIIMAGTIFGERLQYIPSIWLCTFTAVFAAAMFRKIDYRLVSLAVAAAVLALSVRTYERGKDWDNQMSIAVAGVNSAPMSVKTWNNLAVQLGEYAGKEGDPVEMMNKYEEAVSACDKAIAIYPNYVTAIANRGIYNSCFGRYKEAEKDLRSAISMYPNHFVATYTLGALLANQGRFEESRKIWEGLMKIHPEDKTLKDSYSRLLKDIQKKEAGIGKQD
ncbi:MAG: tetratricopeptide repeat protein [Victivallales bacterium]